MVTNDLRSTVATDETSNTPEPLQNNPSVCEPCTPRSIGVEVNIKMKNKNLYTWHLFIKVTEPVRSLDSSWI